MSTDALKPDSIDPSVGVSSSPSLASSAVSDGSDASPPTLAALNNYKLRWEQFLVQAEPSQEAKHNTSAALQTLLKHKGSMTMELLRDSGIGKVLNKLRKKVTGDDATLASQLLDSWKSTAAIAAVPASVVAKSESVTTAASPSSSSSSTGAAVATTSTVVTTESSVTIVKTDSSVTATKTETVASSTTTTSSVDTLSEPASRKRKPEDSPSVTTPSKKTSLAQSILSTIDYPLPVRASTTTPSVAAPALPASDAFFAKPMTPAKSLASSSTKSASSSSSSPAAIKSLAPIAPQRILTPASLGPDGDLRLKIRKQISLCFMPPSPTPAAASAAPSIPEELIIIGEQIEDHLYNTICSRSANQLYRTKSRELLMNLKDSRNPELRERVLAGDIDIHTLLTAKFTDLASAALKSEREAALKWEMAERRSDVQANANSITDAWRCGKCKERKCTFYQMQTRSADEPMTTFVRCVNCGNRWKC